MTDFACKLANVSRKRKKFRLSDINMELENGYIYAIVGENGAGKTMLFQTILQEKARYSGEIYVYGKPARGNHDKMMEIIGFVSEDNLFLEDRTGMQNAEILGILYEDFDKNLFRNIMEKMQAPTNRTYRLMSRGERIKFQLGFAIAHHSKLFLLDEATAGMDPVFRLEFFDILRELLKTEECCVLMTSHNMTEIHKQTDYVAVMENGHLGAFQESLDTIGGYEDAAKRQEGEGT